MHLWEPVNLSFYGQPCLFLMNYFLDMDPGAELCAPPKCAPCRDMLDVQEDDTAHVGVVDEQLQQYEAHQAVLQCETFIRCPSFRGLATLGEYVRREAWPTRRRVRDIHEVNLQIFHNCEAAEHCTSALMSALEMVIISEELPQECTDLADDLWLIRDEINYIRSSLPDDVALRRERQELPTFRATGGFALVREAAQRALHHIRPLQFYCTDDMLSGCIDVLEDIAHLRGRL